MYGKEDLKIGKNNEKFNVTICVTVLYVFNSGKNQQWQQWISIIRSSIHKNKTQLEQGRTLVNQVIIRIQPK